MLTRAEKTWLIFQLLCGVAQLKSADVVHGDIKPDNILITSYDWLFIADCHPYKPVLIPDDNLKEYNMMFGDLNNNTRAYTAPERWRSPAEAKNTNVRLDHKMDIFSAGCCIAEIMMDGHPLFDLPKLQAHRKGNFNAEQELRKRIDDSKIVQLILKMVNRDPAERPPINECIQEWNEQVFPMAYSKVLF
jgi:phosphoinositide-3-kinase regulatory subunit 4